jgi:hypothetical protein
VCVDVDVDVGVPCVVLLILFISSYFVDGLETGLLFSSVDNFVASM